MCVQGFYISSVVSFLHEWGEISAESLVVIVHPTPDVYVFITVRSVCNWDQNRIKWSNVPFRSWSRDHDDQIL